MIIVDTVAYITTSLGQSRSNGGPDSQCSGQNLTLVRMMTRIPATKSFHWEIHKSQSPSQSLGHIQPPPKVILRPEHPSIPKSHSTIMRLLPPRGFYHFEIFPVLKVSTPNLKLQQQIVQDLRRYLCNAFPPCSMIDSLAYNPTN